VIEESLTEVNALATNTFGSVWHIASDFLVLIVIFFVVFLVAWRVGRGFIVSLLISLYVGYALYSIFPYASYLPADSPVIALISSLAVFIAITVVAFLILHRAIVSDFISIGVVGLIILSLLGAGFLLALAFHAFPIRAIYDFSPAISALFAPNEYFFAWFVAPLLGLFFIVR
jgi:hypothetical protein